MAESYQSCVAPTVFKIVLFSVITSLLFISGCVRSGTYQALQQEKLAVEEQKSQLEKDLAATQAKAAQLTADNSALEAEKTTLMQLTQQTEVEKARMAAAVEAARMETARQQATFDNLRTQFSSEMQSNQVKIELLKTGIKVNLAQEVLFPSGSAQLNGSGEEIIRKIVSELKQGAYQINVAGFTDNVAISANLIERYPSNWELAGARAASVVRLLERDGVSAARMVATSYGENSPVASNADSAGRALNRRIEISLRPLEVVSP